MSASVPSVCCAGRFPAKGIYWLAGEGETLRGSVGDMRGDMGGGRTCADRGEDERNHRLFCTFTLEGKACICSFKVHLLVNTASLPRGTCSPPLLLALELP